MPETSPVLVTGAAGAVGGVGRHVVTLLRASNVPVRAVVRRNDDRAAQLRDLGAEVVIADLAKSEQVFPLLAGCKRIFFSTSVSSQYLESTMVMAASARAQGDIELLVNMSQMTVSEMDLTHVTESPQHRLQFLSEQALNWSGVPVTHLRATAFQENPLFWGYAAKSIETTGTVSMPFGKSRVNPIAAKDVSEVAATVLMNPSRYAGQILELTGPKSVNMYDHVTEYSTALGRDISYVPVSLDEWKEMVQKSTGSDHTDHHITAMAKLHAEGRYDRYTDSVKEILGRPATSLSENITNDRSHFPVN
jgi:uncharacterized protein YbjT (DUF2867 family)